jgi:colanic acid/amylovoran biosynthesis glycosyltransferase
MRKYFESSNINLPASRPLRIAIFLSSFPVVSETFILRQITGLLDLGHEVDIYADVQGTVGAPVQPEVAKYHLLERTAFMSMPVESTPWEMPVRPWMGRIWIPGQTTGTLNLVRILRALPVFAKAFLKHPRLTLQALSPSHAGPQAESLSALYRFARLSAVTKRYDILHAHFGPVGNSYRFARKLWDAPLIVSFHGYDCSTVPQNCGNEVYRELFRDADVITANSDSMAGKLEALGCPAAKIRKLEYGIDITQFDFPPSLRTADDPIRVLTIGRLVEKKGIEYSIRAVAQVRERHPGVAYDIVGDGPLRLQLEALTAELGASSCVKFHGARDGIAVRQLLSRAHIFVLASVTANNGDQEGTPVSLLEAQAAGLPVISTRHSGIPEIAREGETGFLVKERNANELAMRLSQLIQSPEFCRDMGRKGKTFVSECFDSSAVTKKLQELYMGAAQ